MKSSHLNIFRLIFLSCGALKSHFIIRRRLRRIAGERWFENDGCTVFRQISMFYSKSLIGTHGKYANQHLMILKRPFRAIKFKSVIGTVRQNHKNLGQTRTSISNSLTCSCLKERIHNQRLRDSTREAPCDTGKTKIPSILLRSMTL